MTIIEISIDGQELTVVNEKEIETVEKSLNYVKIQASFSQEWDVLLKTMYFQNPKTGKIYSQLLSEDGSCIVPHEALDSKGYISFAVSGTQGEERVTTTKGSFFNRSTVYGGEETDPTPSDIEQLKAYAQQAQTNAQTAQGIAEDIKEKAENGELTGMQGPPGEDYVLTEQDKQEIAGMVKTLNGHKLTAYFPQNADDAVSAVVELTERLTELSPVLFMPLYDDEELSFEYGVGMLIVDSGTGNIENSIIIPLSYSEVPFTRDYKVKLDGSNNFVDSYENYYQFKELSYVTTTVDALKYKSFIKVGTEQFGDFSPKKYRFYGYYEDTLSFRILFNDDYLQKIYPNISLSEGGSSVSFFLEMEQVGNCMLYNLILTKDSGETVSSTGVSVLKNSKINSICLPNEVNVNFACAKR